MSSNSDIKRIYGIDLGTTYSCVSYVDQNGQAVPVWDRDTNTVLVPSVVYFQNDVDPAMPDAAKTDVGNTAKQMAKMEPERVAKLVKSHMYDKGWVFKVDEKSYDPAVISGVILSHLAKAASEALNEVVKEVVITVPAYFGPFERERTVEAGRLAGLIVHDVLPEPMAAALYYGITDDPGKQTVLVYDLGGGTFDVTVMTFSEERKESLATRGDHNLGGNRWDHALALHWATAIGQTEGSGGEAVIWSNLQTRENLLFEAELAKQRLTKSASTTAIVTHDGTNYTVRIDRATFDEITNGLLAKCDVYVDEALAIAKGRQPGVSIDTILLVGGSTLMPQVRQRLIRKFGEKIKILNNQPHLAVALGAAIYAYQMQVKAYIKQLVDLQVERYGTSNFDELPEATKEKILNETSKEFGRSAGMISDVIRPTFTDVSPRSFGVKHGMRSRPKEHFVTNLVTIQQPMPASGTKTFYTMEANQPSVAIVCVVNERSLGMEDEPVPFDPEEVIGEAELRLSGKLPDSSPIEMSIEFNSTGRIHVTGRDMTDGHLIEVDFRMDGLRSDKEVAAGRAEMADLTATLGKD